MNTALPIVPQDRRGDAVAQWWSTEPDGRIECHLCPRACRLNPGDRGFCFVRANRDGKMVLDTYGRSTGFCIDPIEKKPLNHFLPGTPVLSFGTAGCNLGCKFCQNWDISKSREVARLSDSASPQDIATAAHRTGCRSVAFTYNDPVIWAEYAIDTAAACHAAGLKTVAVTAGYITSEARGDFFGAMDATNIDLKAFTEDFYFKLTGAHLDPILDTIRYVVHETDCWVELTNLIIPRANDDQDELKRMCDWVLEAVGPDVPVHFSAFHPDFRMRDRPATPVETLQITHDLARQRGLRYVYVGNVHDVERQSTYCPGCGQLLIERDWHQLGRYAMSGNRCGHCGFEIAGQFETNPGDWGRRRQPIRIAPPESQVTEISSGRPSSDASHQLQGTAVSAIAGKSNVAEFSPEQLKRIHEAACRHVESVVTGRTCDAKSLLGELADQPVAGMYVSLKRGETLRGCCGLQGPPVSLGDALVDASTRTALHDPRMSPIAAVELPYLTLSISILGPPYPIAADGDDRIDAVEVGRHGLRIRMQDKSGLLLPVVARERGWNARQFLDAICNKAGLPPGSWRSSHAAVELFDGVDYGSGFTGMQSEDSEARAATDEEIDRLMTWAANNLVAIHTGATPLYYANDVSDRSVQGVVLQIVYAEDQPPASWLQFQVRDGIPLQATLFQMTQNAAAALASVSFPQTWRVEIALLDSVTHHGTAEDCDLAGVDRQRRMLIALDGKRWSVSYDNDDDVEAQLSNLLEAQPFRRDSTSVFSARCETNTKSFAFSMGPAADGRLQARSPALAGKFYPAEDSAREALVDQLFEGLEAVNLEAGDQMPVCAAMVPHAGLRFSGRIAADTLRRIKLPQTVLIIGPKHTPDGVDWAVAPHDSWRLSGVVAMKGNAELAVAIADRVPGMQLDASAHAREHGIEVQLPILHRISPETKICAIAMAGGTLDELRDAAKGLADLIRELDDPPLLVISSDMNHFADETENRRRDRIALDVLKRNDPEQLLDVCADENISMCGLLPAALVLLTLRELNVDVEYREIGYATSADTTGDPTRVVGYAGVLF